MCESKLQEGILVATLVRSSLVTIVMHLIRIPRFLRNCFTSIILTAPVIISFVNTGCRKFNVCDRYIQLGISVPNIDENNDDNCMPCTIAPVCRYRESKSSSPIGCVRCCSFLWIGLVSCIRCENCSTSISENERETSAYCLTASPLPSFGMVPRTQLPFCDGCVSKFRLLCICRCTVDRCFVSSERFANVPKLIVFIRHFLPHDVRQIAFIEMIDVVMNTI
mmetsp:Transcript_10404/g.12665  ORF Transcript_10404/g.12665 Transcript_10404/m.12665 type:complete len:222 (-) Transcript_10404:73-738(-)